MDLNKEAQKRASFRDILLELSHSQDVLENPHSRSNMYIRLEELYSAAPGEKPFRHFYSDIFSVLQQIKSDSSRGDVEILGQNLDIIRKGYKSVNKSSDGEPIDITDSINKLYDHVSLDIARMAYTDQRDLELIADKHLNDINENVTTMSEKMSLLETKASETEKKLDTQQREYIAILGIFASVVLAFTGGLSFSTSVLESMQQAGVYRLLIMSLIAGLVLVNILFGLFYYINRIVHKENKIKPLLVSNAVFLFLIVCVLVSWCFGIVESRNERFAEELHDSIIVNTE